MNERDGFTLTWEDVFKASRSLNSVLACKFGQMHRGQETYRVCTCFSACWAWMTIGEVGD